MPRLDRAGPLGRGPMTGRGMGDCPRFVSQEYATGWQNLSVEKRLEILEKDKEEIEKKIKELKREN